MSATIPQTMKALKLVRSDKSSTPKVVLVQDEPVPTPSADHLLLRVIASPVHPSDLLNAQGGFPHTTFPRIRGRDYVGTVVALGEHSAAPHDDTLLGATVFGTSGNTIAFTEDGAHAEYVVVSIAGVARVPASISPAAAAALGVPWTTAALALERARATKGETILILGANGAVGTAAVHLAQAKGCKVLRGVQGPSGDVDTKGDPTLQRVDRLTNGKGVDIVFDTAGVADLTTAAVTRLGLNGRLVFVAGNGQLQFNMREFYRKSASIVGTDSLAESIERMGSRLREMTTNGAFDGLNSQALESTWEMTSLDEAVAAYGTAAADEKTKFGVTMS